jgi:hypothetical protein
MNLFYVTYTQIGEASDHPEKAKGWDEVVKGEVIHQLTKGKGDYSIGMNDEQVNGRLALLEQVKTRYVVRYSPGKAMRFQEIYWYVV